MGYVARCNILSANTEVIIFKDKRKGNANKGEIGT